MKYIVFLIIAIVLLGIYIRHTYRFPNKLVILQTSLNDFNLKMLQEKQPIVVQDRVDNIKPIWDGWFRYNIKGHFEIRPEMEWLQNRHKYMLLYGIEDGEVMLCSPRCKTTNNIPDPTEEIVAIKLYKGMSVIIPYRWHVAVSKPVYAGGIHDLFTYLLPA